MISAMARALVEKKKIDYTLKSKKMAIMWEKVLRTAEEETVLFPRTSEGNIAALLFVHMRRSMKIEAVNSGFRTLRF